MLNCSCMFYSQRARQICVMASSFIYIIHRISISMVKHYYCHQHDTSSPKTTIHRPISQIQQPNPQQSMIRASLRQRTAFFSDIHLFATPSSSRCGFLSNPQMTPVRPPFFSQKQNFAHPRVQSWLRRSTPDLQPPTHCFVRAMCVDLHPTFISC